VRFVQQEYALPERNEYLVEIEIFGHILLKGFLREHPKVPDVAIDVTLSFRQ
jgi:hypothetical protein